MGEVRLSTHQAEVLAAWAEAGLAFVAITLRDDPLPYVAGWQDGDVLATQGDAHIHLGEDGAVKAVVPPSPAPASS
jgi:hypothetical protein